MRLQLLFDDVFFLVWSQDLLRQVPPVEVESVLNVFRMPEHFTL